MDGDLYYPMSRKRLGHAVIINNLDREQIPTQRWGLLKEARHGCCTTYSQGRFQHGCSVAGNRQVSCKQNVVSNCLN